MELILSRRPMRVYCNRGERDVQARVGQDYPAKSQNSRLEGPFGAYTDLFETQRQNALPPNIFGDRAFCDEHVKTVRHVMYECKLAFRFWMEYIKWFYLSSALSSNLETSLLQFNRLVKGKEGRLLMVSLWECICWSLWKSHNNLIFRNIILEINVIVDELKARFLSWINVRSQRRHKIFYQQ